MTSINLPAKMNPCEGVCLCGDKEWFKLEARIDQHLELFGVGEICPECGAVILWDCSALDVREWEE